MHCHKIVPSFSTQNQEHFIITKDYSFQTQWEIGNSGILLECTVIKNSAQLCLANVQVKRNFLINGLIFKIVVSYLKQISALCTMGLRYMYKQTGTIIVLVQFGKYHL